MAASNNAHGGRRVAIVDGLRTPFAKSGTDLKTVSTYELGAHVVTELVDRSRVPITEIDRVVYGSVVQDVASPNIAREIVLSTRFAGHHRRLFDHQGVCHLDPDVHRRSQAILMGEADVVITGGADSLSRPPVLFTDEFVEVMQAAQTARTSHPSRSKALAELRPKDLAPQPPAVADRSTGESMGDGAEKMAASERHHP